MVTVKNLTNSPYDLQSVGGPVRLPAFGEVSGEFADDYLLLLEASMAVKVESANIDDGKGDLAKLRAEYTDLTGKKPFHGWATEELQKRIDAALAG